QRAAGELDAVVEAPRRQEAGAHQHDRPRDHVGPAGPLDEVVARVREESDHQTLRVVMAGRRCSQMRKRVFTTKIAETIEAAMPIDSTKPARPGNVNVKPNAARPASVNRQ